MKLTFVLFVFFVSHIGFAQVTSKETSELYNKYREDQFYASVTYNILNNKPSEIAQSGFSSGFHIGFIRDMPLNERRNISLGIGIGISSNSYNQKNVLIEEVNKEVTFNIIDESDYNVSKNKFTTYLIEVPFEFRWRTSTPSEYNFWRIYPGFKAGYLLYNSTKFKSETSDSKLSNIDEFNKFQYGLTLSAGYGTWNFQVYYGLNSIFNDSAKLNGEAIGMESLKIGLMFYIL